MKTLQTTSSTMFITGFSDPDKLNYKKSAHLRKDFGELDVFKAERYFSGSKEAAGFDGAAFPQKNMREERQIPRGGSVSLDIPLRNTLPPHSQLVEKQMKKKEYKQPISPGGKLANFLNSLFHKAASKRKKSKSTTQSVKDEGESPSGRRRRSSISHFRSVSTGDSKSIYSSSSSGFRTPPPYVNTPTNVYKDLRSYSDHKQGVPLSKYNGKVRSTALQNEVLGEKTNKDSAWLDEKHKVSNGFSEKNKNFRDGFSEKERIWVEQYPSEDKNFRRFNEVDDGGESDSSSDLFELQNYDLGYYSSGLPVYETTHMDSIKRGPPISNGPQ